MQNYIVKKRGRQPKNRKFYPLIMQMDIDERLMILKDEWQGAAPLRFQLRKLFGGDFTVGTLLDESGWVIIRTASK